jgi:hypothetical protein
VAWLAAIDEGDRHQPLAPILLRCRAPLLARPNALRSAALCRRARLAGSSAGHPRAAAGVRRGCHAAAPGNRKEALEDSGD